MAKKTPAQIKEEQSRKVAFYRELIKMSKGYPMEFEECLRKDLKNRYPGHNIESLMHDPDERRSFVEDWSSEAIELCKKWNLAMPWDPSDKEDPCIDRALESENDAGPEPVIIPPGRVIYFGASPISLEDIQRSNINIPKPEIIHGNRQLSLKAGQDVSEVTFKTRRLAKFPQSRYLLLALDFYNPKQEISHWLKSVVDHYWMRANPSGSVKNIEPFYDEFCLQVLRMKKAGKNIAQITRELFPKETEGKTFSTDPVAKSMYERVRRASIKAKSLINYNSKED
jgi:hypothetical protein